QCRKPMKRVLQADATQIFVCEQCLAALVDRGAGLRHFIPSSDTQHQGRPAVENPQGFLENLLQGMPPDNKPSVSRLLEKLREPDRHALAVGLVHAIGFYHKELERGNITL